MEDGFELVEVEVGVVLAKKVAALDELSFDVLGVSSRSERLSVPVLLVALDTGCLARGASWVF